MIRYIDVKNLAVIDALQVELGAGLNVVTGETGAGKSVLVGAVGLLIGGRASPDLVRTGMEEARVQAVFEDGAGREHLVRREIASQGRSRAFIDDVIVTTAALRTLASQLVDLHGQHQHQELLDPKTHLSVLDHYADSIGLRTQTQEAFNRWHDAKAKLETAELDGKKRKEQNERLLLEVEEIRRVAPKDGEDRELDTEVRILRNVEDLKRRSSSAYAELYEGDSAALGRLRTLWREIEELSSLDEKFQPYVEASASIDSQLEDLAFFLRSYASSMDVVPGRLEQVEDRLAVLERLKRRFSATLGEIVEAERRSRAALDEHEDASAEIARLAVTLQQKKETYVGFAQKLSSERISAAVRFQQDLEQVLSKLSMERARCEFKFETHEDDEKLWTESGFNEGELFFSANPGEELRRLAKIASGGEMSRVALALRTLTSSDAPGRTLIFDEVDAGIGGHVADVVGRMLRNLADKYQVICITHLPQIAAFADYHYHVSKSVTGGSTVTRLEKLGEQGRVDEIARLMTGAITEKAVAGARELLASKQKTKA